MGDTMERKAGLTTFQLKVLAIISMLADHVGAVLYPEAVWLRYAGGWRFRFSAFCWWKDIIIRGMWQNIWQGLAYSR